MAGMSRGSVKEYGEAIKGRYREGNRREKGKILGQFTQVTGYHRKSVIRLLTRGTGPPGRRRGRPKRYTGEVVEALRIAWEAADRICGKRLKPFLPELVEALVRHGDLIMSEAVKGDLMEMSAATTDRLLKPFRMKGITRPLYHRLMQKSR
ncbi:MAG: hypothetical protein IBX68_09810 [Dehalococcoidia bacterium]|nr:hypothetical protein [Dehalococcoidia bacterium]